jgi:hypothetical protein
MSHSISNSSNLGYCQTFPTKIGSRFHHRYLMDHTELYPTFEEYLKNFSLTYLLRGREKKIPILSSTKNSNLNYIKPK